MITAETKNKKIKTTWEMAQYTYYHCTKRSKQINCTQKAIRVERLEEQIIDILKKIEIIPDFKDWCLNILKENHSEEIEKKEKLNNSMNRNIGRMENKLKNLTDLLLDDIISKDEFLIKKQSLKEEIVRLKEKRDNIDIDSHKIFENTQKVFNFASLVTEKFKNWDLKEKKRNICFSWL